MDPTTVKADTKIIPSIVVSEQYSTNILYVPKEFVPGLTLEDFATTMSPKVMVTNANSWIGGSLAGGANIVSYVNNPGLSYVSGYADLSLNLTGTVQRLIPRAELEISEFFLYTPEPPAFLAPGALGGAASNPFIVGIQTFRANSSANSLSAKGSYTFSPSVSLDGSYLYSRIRFGKGFVPVSPGTLVGMNVHSATVGPRIQLSPRDVLTVNYQYWLMEFGFPGLPGTTQAGTGMFSTQSMNVIYSRNLTPALIGTLSGGVIKIDPGGSLNYLGGASLTWDSSPNDKITFSYSRSVAPGFLFQAAPLVSQAWSATVIHKLTEQVNLIGGANYALSEAAGGVEGVLKFQSYVTSLSITYALTRTINASLSHNYSNYNYEQIGQLPYAFDVHQVTFAISAFWD